ncbi:hypothetical protein MVEN_00781600 [Mycena venus]|uniref:Uncharacterized protein n=1 Tax=Mycena venus TaxID=2733690 RepID=A0A8H7D6E4_9AGAR|nr:hypothetical protein MVEN_00781600 [Mycena venus]
MRRHSSSTTNGSFGMRGNTALAHQVTVCRIERGHFNNLHKDRLVKLSKEPGFTASLSTGVSINKECRVPSRAGESSARDEDVEMDNPLSLNTPPQRATTEFILRYAATPPPEKEAEMDEDGSVRAHHAHRT